MILVNAEQMRRLDALTIEEGTPGIELMNRAGSGATDVLLDHFDEQHLLRVLVCAGKGNNGGDGFVIARLLEAKGINVQTLLFAAETDVGGDAQQALSAFTKAGGGFSEIRSADDIDTLSLQLDSATLVVDALFGTGLNSPLRGVHDRAIALIQESGLPVFAVDTPSGLDCDSGRVLGRTLPATVTATFAFPKLGQVIYPGVEYVGKLVVVDIGISAKAVEEVSPRRSLSLAEDLSELFPPRSPQSHKGSCGHVAIIAGSIGHTGAALLAARASLRSGAGLTTLAGPRSLNTIFSASFPEVMTFPVDDSEGLIDFRPSQLEQLLDAKNAVVIGPGLGLHSAAAEVLEYVIGHSSAPIVLDADALTLVSQNPSLLEKAKVPLVLTPHPGEMSRLSSCDVATVESDRVRMSATFAREKGCTLLLKGARSVVAASDGRVAINPTGNPGMASGGMGDALAGMIGAFLAQGLTGYDAARLAAYLHGDAGDRCAIEIGNRGLLASDLIDRIPQAIDDLDYEQDDDQR